MLVAHGQWPPGDHGQRPLSSAPILNLPGSPSLGSILISSMQPVPGTVKAAFSERELPSKLKLAKLHEQIKGVFWFPFFSSLNNFIVQSSMNGDMYLNIHFMLFFSDKKDCS